MTKTTTDKKLPFIVPGKRIWLQHVNLESWQLNEGHGWFVELQNFVHLIFGGNYIYSVSKWSNWRKLCKFLRCRGQTVWIGLGDSCTANWWRSHSEQSSVKKCNNCKCSQKSLKNWIHTSEWNAFGSSCLSCGTKTRCFWPAMLWYLTWSGELTWAIYSYMVKVWSIPSRWSRHYHGLSW